LDRDKAVDKGWRHAHNKSMGRDLKRKILAEPIVSKIFSMGIKVYLVGGYLRDLIRGVTSKDLDVVVEGDVRGLVSGLFPETHTTIIEFRKALLVRVVSGDTVLDFSELKGSIENDLARRDFRMNAIAWSAQEGIIDPFHGVRDIKKGYISALSEKNLIDDPLRLLRAYRFAGELDWTIEVRTRRMIRGLKNLIKLPASERITLEVFRLLNSERYLKTLRAAFHDGLMEEILSIDNRQLMANIKALSRFNSFLKNFPEECKIDLHKTFSQGLTYIGLMRAEQLLFGSDMGKNHLDLSSAILRRLLITARLFENFAGKGDMHGEQLYDLFTVAGDAVMDFALLTRRKRLLREAERFTRMKNVLSAERIMELTGIGAGPALGNLMKEMRRYQFLGKIKNDHDARVWLCGN
jgi:tRNA nucleotidyltransferase (CCA-adding enzyme)